MAEAAEGQEGQDGAPPQRPSPPSRRRGGRRPFITDVSPSVRSSAMAWRTATSARVRATNTGSTASSTIHSTTTSAGHGEVEAPAGVDGPGEGRGLAGGPPATAGPGRAGHRGQHEARVEGASRHGAHGSISYGPVPRRPGGGSCAAGAPSVVLVLLLVAACGHAGPAERARSARRPAPTTPWSWPRSTSPRAPSSASCTPRRSRAAGVPVRRELLLGPRELVAPALEQGLVDVVPEYLGTALAYLGGEQPDAGRRGGDPGPPGRAAYAAQDVRLLEPAPAEDQNSLVVTEGTRPGLRPAAARATWPTWPSSFRFGGPPECPDRPFCLQGLEEVYGLRVRAVRAPRQRRPAHRGGAAGPGGRRGRPLQHRPPPGGRGVRRAGGRPRAPARRERGARRAGARARALGRGAARAAGRRLGRAHHRRAAGAQRRRGPRGRRPPARPPATGWPSWRRPEPSSGG